MKDLRVFLADDHTIVRNGLRLLIDSQADMEVVGEAADGKSAVSGIQASQPDVAVLDISMPGLGGAEAAERIRRDCPSVRVLVLSAHEEVAYVRQLLAAGAAGYVIKRAAAEDLVRAVRVVAAGQTYIDPAVAAQLVAGLAPHAKPAEADLSEREQQVLRLIASGNPVKKIAAAIDVGQRTVETYKARAMEKLGLKTRADIVRYAASHGWLSG